MLIEENNLLNRIKIRQGDLLDSAISFRDADAVTMYLLPQLIEALRPKLFLSRKKNVDEKEREHV